MTPAEARNILGVSQHATRKEIKAAHRELVFQFHPDKAGKSEERRKRYEEKMKKINVARDVLLNLSRSSSNSQRRHSDTSKNTNQKRNYNTSKNTNQKDYGDAHEYQRWREEQRRKSSAGKEEQERRKEEWKKYNKKTGERGKYYPAKNDSVKRGQILLGIIVIISVLFIINPFSNQSEI